MITQKQRDDFHKKLIYEEEKRVLIKNKQMEEIIAFTHKDQDLFLYKKINYNFQIGDGED